MYDLIDVLVEAGILEKDRYGGYTVIAEIQTLASKVDLLERKLECVERKLEEALHLSELEAFKHKLEAIVPE